MPRSLWSGVFLAASPREVKMRAGWAVAVGSVGNHRFILRRRSARPDRRCAAAVAVLDAHERFGEREPVGGREKVGYIGRRGRLAHAAGMAGKMRRAFEEK